jgi:hypothetical protein
MIVFFFFFNKGLENLFKNIYEYHYHIPINKIKIKIKSI